MAREDQKGRRRK